MTETVVKKRSAHDEVWLPPQRKTELTQEEKRQALIRQIMQMERLSMIEYVRRNTPALAGSISCYRFAGE